MDKDTSLQASPKKPPAGQAIVVTLLAIHGIVLIVIGLIAFFAGFVGAYNVSNGHATPGATVAVLGAPLAWIFLAGGIVSFFFPSFRTSLREYHLLPLSPNICEERRKIDNLHIFF